MATQQKSAFEPDPWLGRVLKRPAYRWSGGPGDPRFRGPGFYGARLDTSNVSALKAWFKAGFNLVDVAVTLDRPPAHGRLPAGPATRPLAPGDAAALIHWAARCFTHSRFHLDPHLSQHQAHAVKCAWVKDIVAGKRADKTWVGLWNGRVAGFLARRTVREDGRRVGVLDLMAVRPSCRGRGVGEALVRRFVHDSADCAWLRVGTQAANAPSLRLYQRCGFAVASTHFALHAHRGRRG